LHAGVFEIDDHRSSKLSQDFVATEGPGKLLCFEELISQTRIQVAESCPAHLSEQLPLQAMQIIIVEVIL
jgi:hypothetical protein